MGLNTKIALYLWIISEAAKEAETARELEYVNVPGALVANMALDCPLRHRPAAGVQ
jgi:hypothetical protein